METRGRLAKREVTKVKSKKKMEEKKGTRKKGTGPTPFTWSFRGNAHKEGGASRGVKVGGGKRGGRKK